MINVNDFKGATDSEIFENALRHKEADGIVLIPPRRSSVEPERDYWLIDRAILLPENTTVILQNAKIKLSDRCRDNFFRSANSGIGIEFPKMMQNIHIRGEGFCVLEGADHPRATGDGSKELHCPCPHAPAELCAVADWIPAERRTLEALTFFDVHAGSYGTDAGNPAESQYGDWRGIGILLANVENFSISGLLIRESHGWGISLEACTYGRVEKIRFDACMHKTIDGMVMNMENQDGIDLRNGCHHIVVSDITGHTGDDVIALTAIANPNYKPGGSMRSTHVMHNDWAKRERDIHDIVIQNVVAHSYLCYVVRLLPAMSRIYNVTIQNIIDDGDPAVGTTLAFGNSGHWGGDLPDALRDIAVSNVICNSKKAISVKGTLSDSVFSNIINRNPDCPLVTTEYDGKLIRTEIK